MKAYDILLVDDDQGILKMMTAILEEQGYAVTTANNGDTAIALIDKKEVMNEKNFDMVITDLVMSPTGGLEVLKKTKELNPEILVIILTGFGDMKSAIEALRGGADDYLLKTANMERIHYSVSRCFEKLELKRKIKFYENILPVCDVCKKIRDDTGKADGEEGRWMILEDFIQKRTGMSTSTICCPDCMKKYGV